MVGHGGAARTMAKVAIVLPAQLFYLAEPTALAFPTLLGLVTFGAPRMRRPGAPNW